MFRGIKIILDKNQRSQLYFAFIVVLLGGMSLSNIQCVMAQQKNFTIEPNEKMQSLFTNIMSPSEEDKEAFFGDGEKFLQTKLSELKELGGKNYEKLIPQLVYYSVYYPKKEGEDDIVKAMLAGFVIEQLQISNEQIRDAILPYLGVEDERLKKQMYNWLGGFDYNDTTRTRDYSYYQSFIETRKDNPPEGLMQYMYWRSSGTALLSLMDVYMEDFMERQDIIQAEQAIREDINRRHYGPIEEKSNVAFEAMSALNELSKRDEWWIRLYVAEILLRQPEFRTPEILERLKKDKHPLVSEVLSQF